VSREVEANTRLVKLHLQWPDRRKHLESDREALEFFKYLFLNFHMDRDVLALESVDEVEVFLEKNRRLLSSKPSQRKPKNSNGRIEPRIANDAHVMLNVSDCDDAELIGVTSNGKALDVGLHGLQVRMDKKLPERSRVKLTLTTTSGDPYELEAQIKWSRGTDDGQLIGLRIQEIEGFGRWHAEFGAKFVSPQARQHEPRQHNSREHKPREQNPRNKRAKS
tara:strand:+ start:36640 stop:37302 length:663 start_codon:yes stop_codon:yes gene_type:complete